MLPNSITWQGPVTKIKYVDFTSLYPYVNKYGRYPVGHPTIITENFGDVDVYEGLIKCKVLPPRGLYHPVLPYKASGRLMFPLCAKCAETLQQSSCLHRDEERALMGTWVTLELKQALDKGYKLLQTYEVWHFDKVAVYDPDTKEGGLALCRLCECFPQNETKSERQALPVSDGRAETPIHQEVL